MPDNDFFSQLRSKACGSPKRIVYPEGNDIRVVKAVKTMVRMNMIKPILLGDRREIEAQCRSEGVDISDVTIMNPKEEHQKEQYYTEIHNLFKKRGVSPEEAKKLACDHLNFGCLLVHQGGADGFVGGAVRTTADTVRAAFRIIGLSTAAPTLSSCFLIEIDDKNFGYEGRCVYADCGVVIRPTAKQLANIAVSSVKSFKDFIGSEPKVAFISFSTKGSAEDESIEKIKQAIETVKSKNPDIAVDGEMQFDAAVDTGVAAKKIKGGSPVAGKANVFIFPDLNSGNIAYKITHRLAKARAVGPILQGLAGAANDLSRGCSADDIIDATAVTVLQAESIGTAAV